MGIQSEEVIDFAEQIDAELRKEDKAGWKGKDVWWYLSQLVKELRLMDSSLSSDSQADISDKAVSIAAYAMIIAYNQREKRSKRGKKRRKKS